MKNQAMAGKTQTEAQGKAIDNALTESGVKHIQEMENNKHSLVVIKILKSLKDCLNHLNKVNKHLILMLQSDIMRLVIKSLTKFNFKTLRRPFSYV